MPKNNEQQWREAPQAPKDPLPLNVRMNLEQKRAIDDMAKRCGYENTAAAVRDTLFWLSGVRKGPMPTTIAAALNTINNCNALGNTEPCI